MRAGLRALLASDDTISLVEDFNEAGVVITTPASTGLSTGASTGLSTGALSVSILYLSGDPPDVRAMKRLSQAWGVLPLDASAEELLAAVHALAEGLIVGPASMLFPQEEETSDLSPLTERESEVINLLAKGMANKQIAAALNISEHTVKFHVSSIYTKLNVTNRTEALREGLRAGWIAL